MGGGRERQRQTETCIQTERHRETKATTTTTTNKQEAGGGGEGGDEVESSGDKLKEAGKLIRRE